MRILALAGSAIAVFGALPAAAEAAFTSPTAVDFGAVPVGTTSPPQTVTLTADCSNLIVIPPAICTTASTTDLVNVSPGTIGDFSFGGSTCPTGLGPSPIGGDPQSCTMNVTFTPTDAGARVGTLSVGTTGIGGLTPGPTVALNGNGLASTASSPTGTDGSKPGARKCKKKKKKAQSAGKRKCKKKKR